MSRFEIIMCDEREGVDLHEWGPDVVHFMSERGIEDLHLNQARGWRGSDISFLSKMPFVKCLSIIDSQINDLSPLYDLPRLKTLNLAVAARTPLDFTRFPSLRSVQLQDWSVRQWGSILQCDALEGLSLFEFSGPNLMLMHNLAALRALILVNPGIRSVEGVEDVPNLRFLRLDRARMLESLYGIGEKARLEVVVLDGLPKLVDLSALSCLPGLRKLAISDCPKLQSLRALENAGNLEALMVWGRNDRLDDRDLRFLSKARNFTNLYLEHPEHFVLPDSVQPRGDRYWPEVRLGFRFWCPSLQE